MVAPQGSTGVPHGSTLITWPADLTTASRSVHNGKQNKLVRSVEQTRDYCFMPVIVTSCLRILPGDNLWVLYTCVIWCVSRTRSLL